jgi:hypothetical protein
MTRTLFVLALLAGAAARADGGSTLFVESAVENPDGTVTLPLYRGTSGGSTVWYILLDSSSGSDADAKGINRSQKLANARGSAAVQKVAVNNGVVDFPATVNFAFGPRVVVPGPGGFPPADARPAAKGNDGYSPIIQLPDGTIEWTSPTGHMYTTYPGSQHLFRQLCQPTATLWVGEPPWCSRPASAAR